MSDRNYKILMVVVSLLVVIFVSATVFYLSNRASRLEPSPTNNSPQTEQTRGGSSFPTSQNTELEPNQNNTAASESNTTNDQEMELYPEETFAGQIKNTANIAVGGISFIEKDRNGELVTFVRYIEKGTGHISEIAFDENIPTKVTNTTITGVFSALWNKDGSSVLLRRLNGVDNEIETIYGQIEAGSPDLILPEGEVGNLNGTVLPANTLDVVSSPQKDKLFYLIKNGDSVVGAVSNFSGNSPFDKKLNIWASPISEWQITWPNQNELMLLTKPAYNVEGYLYSLSVPKENTFEKVMGNITGLTSLVSGSGKKILYSETTGAGFLTFYKDRGGNDIKVFPIKTLPEKCVWSKTNENIVYCGVPKGVIGAKYPDSWYKGLISFNDDIYRIDLDVNSGRKIETVGQPGELDATNLILSPNEDYLSFINKKDGTAWTIKLY